MTKSSTVSYRREFGVKKVLGLFPAVTLLFFLVPVCLGLVCTWLPALGYLPVIGAENIGFDYFRRFWSYPGIAKSLQVTLVSGFGATLLALGVSLWFVICLHGSRLWHFLEKSLAPLLAIPHAAFAIGFGVLISPSGWLLRLFSPHITGFDSPPDLLIFGDPNGISLALVLALKEIPFFLLMIFGVLSQLNSEKLIWLGRSLGYCRTRVWGRLIIPQIFPHLRLPFMAVLAYSLSVVDIALIAGPSKPTTLAVLINSWFYSPDTELRLLGAAGATLLCLFVCLSIIFCVSCEKIFAYWRRLYLTNGSRFCLSERLRWTGKPIIVLFFSIFTSTFIGLFLQSVSHRWRFPDSFPVSYSFRFWKKGLVQSVEPLISTVNIGVVATLISVLLVIGCLEYEVLLADKGKKTDARQIFWLIYVPLIVPQIAFIFGVQMVAVALGLDGHFFSLVAVHVIFVLPYVFLTLAYPYRSFDQRFFNVALCMNGSYFHSLIRVKLMMLLKPILFSMACGFSVSVVQYLPTLYVGAGRFATITTETVTLASGSDRRVAAVYALLQFVLPVLIYFAAVVVPLVVFRNRRAMQS